MLTSIERIFGTKMTEFNEIYLNIKLMMNTKAVMQFLNKSGEEFLIISILIIQIIPIYQLLYELWTSLSLAQSKFKQYYKNNT